MPLKTQVLIREFRYGSVVLPDPAPSIAPDQIAPLFPQYPELISAGVKGPTFEGDREIYTFERSIGSKG